MPPQDRHPAGHVFSVPGLVISMFVIGGILVGAALYASTFLGSSQMAAVVSATLVDLANEDREEESLPALTIDPLLVAAAQAKANDMVEKGYFAHNSPEGVEPWHWFREVGYDYAYAGENLAVNFSDSENVEDAWMESPKHRANILNGKFTHIGIATASGIYEGKKTTFVVQMFGTPRSQASAPITTAAPRVEPTTPEIPEEPAIAVAPEASDTSVLGSEVEAVPVTYSEPADRILVSPQTLIHLLYLICAAVIIAALFLATRMEFKRHHFKHMAAASFLLVVILSCLIIADRIIFTAPIVG